MSAFSENVDRLRGYVDLYVGQVKRKIFGANNENIDFLMDSFYKLDSNQRNMVVAGFIAVVVVFVLGAFGLYFSQIGALKKELNDTFSSLHELRRLKSVASIEDDRFNGLVKHIQRKTKSLNLKPYFEQLSRAQGVALEGLNETPENSNKSLIADRVQEMQVSMKITNVSIPRMLGFIEEFEKSKQMLRVKNMRIRNRFGTRLFFDVELAVRGYKVGRG